MRTTISRLRRIKQSNFLEALTMGHAIPGNPWSRILHSGFRGIQLTILNNLKLKSSCLLYKKSQVLNIRRTLVLLESMIINEAVLKKPQLGCINHSNCNHLILGIQTNRCLKFQAKRNSLLWSNRVLWTTVSRSIRKAVGIIALTSVHILR